MSLYGRDKVTFRGREGMISRIRRHNNEEEEIAKP
jgi:hypothetical protein